MVGKKAGESTGLHRRHLRPARPHQVKARFSDVELATIVEAAGRAGLTPTSYMANAAVREAAGGVGYADVMARRETAMVVQATVAELRRLGNLLNQAVTIGHTSGMLPAVVEPLAVQFERLARDCEGELARLVAGLP